MRQADFCFPVNVIVISIHAPTWGATIMIFCIFILTYISIHAPTWGATRNSGQSLTTALFQSTHPHGVRPSYSVVSPRGVDISIHAPTWGATALRARSSSSAKISIHAPTWGATSMPLTAEVALDYFNPRTHMGCD